MDAERRGDLLDILKKIRETRFRGTMRGRCPDCWEVIEARGPADLTMAILEHRCVTTRTAWDDIA